MIYHVMSSWSDARLNCQKIGKNGDLASVPDDATTLFIMENFNFTQHAWIGGRRKSTDGVWEWSDGSEWFEEYENWDSGQPNDIGEVATYFFRRENDHWYDAVVTDEKWSFCQYSKSK